MSTLSNLLDIQETLDRLQSLIDPLGIMTFEQASETTLLHLVTTTQQGISAAEGKPAPAAAPVVLTVAEATAARTDRLVMDALKANFATTGATVRQLSKAAGLPESTLYKARRRLTEAGLITIRPDGAGTVIHVAGSQ